MHVRFAAPELKSIDALRCEALALPLFSDERPLRGALGLIDWRLCGFVSRLLVSGAISGAPLETVMIPGRPKFTLSKLLLVGAGAHVDFEAARFQAVARHMLATLQRAGVRSSALVLPGRQSEAIEPAAAMELFAEVASAQPGPEDWVLLESGDAQRAMQPVIERERRRARARMP